MLCSTFCLPLLVCTSLPHKPLLLSTISHTDVEILDIIVFPFVPQDEKNQLMTTNVWLWQVKTNTIAAGFHRIMIQFLYCKIQDSVKWSNLV